MHHNLLSILAEKTVFSNDQFSPKFITMIHKTMWPNLSAYQILDNAIPTQTDQKSIATTLSAEQRNSARVAMIKKGCSLNTQKLKFSTLHELQYNLTNNLGLGATRLKTQTNSPKHK